MIRLTRSLTVNPDHVVSVEWDRRHYFNGPGDSYLVITMIDGVRHRIRHEPGYYDGTDCYAIEKALLAASDSGGRR